MPRVDKIKVGLIDDHDLLRSGLTKLFSGSKDYIVTLEAANGSDLIDKLRNTAKKDLPGLVFLDIRMPKMDGFDTLVWLKENYPSIKVIILTMYDADLTVVKMVRIGADGYLLKNVSPEELFTAANTVMKDGSYYPDWVTKKIIDSIRNTSSTKGSSNDEAKILFSERELEIIKLVCSELTIKEIANKLYLSERTIDGYIQSLLQKLKVNSRVGLVIYALKNNIVDFSML